MSKPRWKKRSSKRILALPDLERSKTAVLNSLTSKSGRRTYDRAITDFVEWNCSEPRLAFNRTVVLQYRIFLEQRQYAPTTINLRLAAVRRLAFEAAGFGLLSPELAAGIRRVKGVRHSCRADRMRTPARRTAGLACRRYRIARGTLDYCQLDGEGWADGYRADSGLGEVGDRQMEGGQWLHRRSDLSIEQQNRPGLGQWNDRKGTLAGRSRRCPQRRHTETGST
jgi:hypothetical protein